jgi:hypothetical protein
MTPCPHCLGQGIGEAAKRRSSREYPATCTLCGRLSHVLASTRSGIPVATFFIIGGFIIWGAVVEHLLFVGLVGVPIAVAFNIWMWKRAELFPIAGENASTARRVNWVVNVLALLGIFWS